MKTQSGNKITYSIFIFHCCFKELRVIYTIATFKLALIRPRGQKSNQDSCSRPGPCHPTPREPIIFHQVCRLTMRQVRCYALVLIFHHFQSCWHPLASPLTILNLKFNVNNLCKFILIRDCLNNQLTGFNTGEIKFYRKFLSSFIISKLFC